MRLVNFCMFGVLDQPIFLNSGIFLADGKLKHRICSQIVSLSLKVVSLKKFSVENGFHAGMDAQPRREVFLHSFFCTLHILQSGLKKWVHFFGFKCATGGAGQSLQVPRVSPEWKWRSIFWPKYAKINQNGLSV